MTEVHIKEELGSLDLTLQRYSSRPEAAWDIEIRHKRKAINMNVEDLENLQRKVDKMIEEAKNVDLEDDNQ